MAFLSVTRDMVFRERVTKAVDNETAATSSGFVGWDLSYRYPGEETVWSSPQPRAVDRFQLHTMASQRVASHASKALTLTWDGG